MKPTTVGHVREGRKSGVYIGRGSPYGNPFKIGEHGDRAEVVEKFRVYFEGRMKTDARFARAVALLRGKHLLCYCHPLACHGDVIAEYVNEYEPWG